MKKAASASASSPSSASKLFPAFALPDEALARRWREWQPGRPGAVAGDFALADFDPSAKPFSQGAKAGDKAAVLELAEALDELQNLFYADRRFKLLVLLQGTDTSGKDGTVRGVFGRTSPLGVRVVGWKAPTEVERAHDYLWRIHAQMPAAGEMVVFNRSHYEDVLVPVVQQWITPEQHAQRLAHINDFERMLAETGTVILKFMLHIGKEEQRERLQARLDDSTKHWKFEMGDIAARQQWDDYQRAYQTLLAATHTPWAPWTIVPANSKTHRNLMIATVLRGVMENLGLRYPEGDPALANFKVE